MSQSFKAVAWRGTDGELYTLADTGDLVPVNNVDTESRSVLAFSRWLTDIEIEYGLSRDTEELLAKAWELGRQHALGNDNPVILPMRNSSHCHFKC